MKLNLNCKIHFATIALLLCIASSTFSFSQVSVGSGSYTTNHPGLDAAGRNGYPSGTPFLSGAALNRPVPTNDWWSKVVKEGQAANLFNYPLTLKTTNNGLIVTYIPWGVIGDSQPITIGLSGLQTNQTTVSDHSDWTVQMSWQDSDQQMKVTAGIGMPFLYFEKGVNDQIEISIRSGQVTVENEQLRIENASHGADFVVYAPSGSTWTATGDTYRTDGNGKTYWSVAMLPQNTQDLAAMATQLAPFAYVFPSRTSVAWNYDENSAELETTFTVDVNIKEGTNTQILQGLLPHQWSHLSDDSAQPSALTYETVRGQMKMLEGNTFKTMNQFAGILPTLPNLTQYSDTYDPAALISKIKTLENSQLDLWTDSYNEGQLMNRLIQTARAAHEIGEESSRDLILQTVKERLEDWLSYTAGEKAFLFYYNQDWTTLIGYPAGHGQDSNINDHHFHWGYFIHAAAFVEQFQPGWVNQWGPMIELLIRDAAAQNRNDTKFPFLRNFSPFAGHSWANGFASFPQGNDQESTSESMQFNSSLIHYGTITGRDDIRDLGIYLYTTEQTAIDEYWFDVEERNFKSNQTYGLVSRVWGNSYDNGTFWTSDITASYGIEFYPIHGGSFYLGRDQDYAAGIWNEIEQYTEILSPDATNPNLWHDTFWKYLALTNPSRALELYELSPNRNLKFGVSDAQTYYWLHALEALGIHQPQITANYPIAAVFEKNGVKTYMVHNYGTSAQNVSFSDGFILNAAPQQMTTSRDIDVSGVLETDFLRAYPNSRITLRLNQLNGPITAVAFYQEGQLIGTDTQAPFEITTAGLPLGQQSFWARIYTGDDFFDISNILTVQVGEQAPYSGNRHQIPGTIEAGHYDLYEGGKGQNISYLDLSPGNNGNFRTEEDVDAGTVPGEGTTVGWIDAGEWLEYSIDVSQSGYYDLSFRYASGNTTGGGPFYLEIDGTKISPDIQVNSTSAENWDTWASKNVEDIELTPGEHTLRIVFTQGGFNLGRLTFSRDRDLPYNTPVANAGDNLAVVLPNSTAALDGSASQSNGAGTLSYQWRQLYGPNPVSFNNPNSSNPTITNLVEGIYRIELEVSAGGYSDRDQLYIIVNSTGNHPPAVRLDQPQNQQSFRVNDDIVLEAQASDLDGTIDRVRFLQNNNLISEQTQAPYRYTWENVAAGTYTITAEAIDNLGGRTTSEPKVIQVEEVLECSQTHTGGQQGQFSTGYISSFETVGTTLNIEFELLDTDKSGVVGFLWQESPFQEFQMEQTGERRFRKSISGYTTGDPVSFACKFAYAGGMVVTNYIDYVVGSTCSETAQPNPPESDTEAPENLSASISQINSTAVSFEVRATDNSGAVIYVIRQGNQERTFNGQSGETSNIQWTGLLPETAYTFEIRVKDASNNLNSDRVELNATTLANQNSSCAGESSEAAQGNFSVGYRYSFQTNGSNVTIQFELLDNRPDVVAYLWQENPFSEVPMENIGERQFQKVLTNQTAGQTISYACKFAFAGGLAVTRYIRYEVGDNCQEEVVLDSDGDGIIDALDSCEDTPSGTTVTAAGCPDQDGDGVPDEVDQCPTSSPNSQVNPLGCEDALIYPNPSDGPIHLYIHEEDSEILITVNDLGGQQIIQYLVRVPDSRIISLDLSFITPGLYILNVEGDTLQSQHKVVIL